MYALALKECRQLPVYKREQLQASRKAASGKKTHMMRRTDRNEEDHNVSREI